MKRIKYWYFFHNKCIPIQKRWISHYLLLGLIIQFITLSLFAINAYSLVEERNYDYAFIWYGSLHFFTQQTNIMCSIFVIFFFFKADWKIFRNSFLLSCVTSYITITFLGFNIFLIPGGIYQAVSVSEYILFDSIEKSLISILRHIFSHEFNPIYMIVLFNILTRNGIVLNKTNIRKIYKYWLPSLIYPALYLTYASSIPFLTAGVNGRNISVYMFFTNTCPWCYYESTWNDPSSASPGSYFNFIIVACFFLLFIFITFTYIGSSTPFFIKRKNDKYLKKSKILEKLYIDYQKNKKNK